MAITLQDKALGLLARREYSRAELKRKLRGLSSIEQIEELLDLLCEQGLQSDSRYVDCYVRSRITAGYGPNHICAQLRQHNIDEVLIAEYVGHEQSFWQEQIKNVYQKKYHGSTIVDQKDYARRGRFLAQRGFSYDMIQQVLKG